MRIAWIAWQEDREELPVPQFGEFGKDVKGDICRMWMASFGSTMEFIDGPGILVYEGEKDELPEPASAFMRARLGLHAEIAGGCIEIGGPYGQYLVITPENITALDLEFMTQEQQQG